MRALLLYWPIRDVSTLSQDKTHKKLDNPSETRQHIWEDIHDAVVAGPGREEEKSNWRSRWWTLLVHTWSGTSCRSVCAFTSAGAPETLEWDSFLGNSPTLQSIRRWFFYISQFSHIMLFSILKHLCPWIYPSLQAIFMLCIIPEHITVGIRS